MAARSRTCPGCGAELARCRAEREAHYGLLVVTCPSCGRVDHAPSPDVRRLRRSLRRLLPAAGTLLVQLAVAGALLGILIGFTITYVRIYEDRGSPFHELPFEIAVITTLAMLGLGGWLRAGLSHWRTPIAFAAVAGMATVAYATDTVIAPAVDALLPAGTHFSEGFALDTFGYRLIALALWLLVATLGVPLGMLLERIDARVRRARRAAVRARRRERTHGLLAP